MKTNVKISRDDLGALLVCNDTRKAALKITERVKWSKYDYNNQETTEFTFYYFEADKKEIERLIELVTCDSMNSPLYMGLSAYFVIHLVKKKLLVEGGKNIE